MCSESANWKSICFQLWTIGFKMGSCLLPELDWSPHSWAPILTCPSSAVDSAIPILSSLNYLVIFSWHFGIFLAECILLFCVYPVATFHESACVCYTHTEFHVQGTFHHSSAPSCSGNYSLSPTRTASSHPIQVPALLLSIYFTHGFWIFLPKI